MVAQAAFLERVIERHPRPTASRWWSATARAAGGDAGGATRPELFGPLIIAGAPLSYWAGVHGQNPMRYSGGLNGGSWLTALTGDLGHGIFDGAALVQNFEHMNPSNTLWTKQYNLYAKVDREGPRYLEFEQWWGGHVLLNAEEMQWIVDNLFVGNKLATAEIVTGDGVRIDFRNITSPIICFCSKGDDITPPQQALGWILDLYGSVDDIRANGQTIVYCVHDKIGHLGIFVSGSVAKKEHQEFATNIDFIDCLPPGLYETVLTPVGETSMSNGPVVGDYVVRFEQRTLDDIRALGCNDLEDERKFAAVARLSEVNLGLYRTFLQPWVRATTTEQSAQLLRRLSSSRLQFELFSDRNPFMQPIAAAADLVRANRRPASAANPLLAAQEFASQQIVAALDGYRDWRDAMVEASFHAAYGSPLMQALLGLRASDDPPRHRPGRQPEEIAFVQQQIAEIEGRMDQGGLREAFVRSIIYIRLPELAADERSFAVLSQLRKEHASDLSLVDFKALVRDQFLMLELDEAQAVATIPLLLQGHGDHAAKALELLESVVTAPGPLGQEAAQRLRQIGVLFTAAAASPAGDAGENRPPRRRLTIAGGSGAEPLSGGRPGRHLAGNDRAHGSGAGERGSRR